MNQDGGSQGPAPLTHACEDDGDTAARKRHAERDALRVQLTWATGRLDEVLSRLSMRQAKWEAAKSRHDSLAPSYGAVVQATNYEVLRLTREIDGLLAALRRINA